MARTKAKEDAQEQDIAELKEQMEWLVPRVRKAEDKVLEHSIYWRILIASGGIILFLGSEQGKSFLRILGGGE